MRPIFLLIATVLFWCLHTEANRSFSTECKEVSGYNDNLQFSRERSSDGECWVSLHPRNGYVDLKYRDYLLSSSGLLLVFNSYGHGPESETTGAREFYFFP